LGGTISVAIKITIWGNHHNYPQSINQALAKSRVDITPEARTAEAGDCVTVRIDAITIQAGTILWDYLGM
jgi:hypothetical protein